jgi:phosphoribosylaminoimidazolecarboxamide formyltransferase/IMP cyclohydrolase
VAAVKRALISVSDKTGVVDFARALAGMGVELLSTGGTAKLLRDAGLAVKEVSEHTGFPEMMEGRVKTLHPKVHGGLLGRRGTDDKIMAEHGILPIDILAVNLYPFEATVAKSSVTFDEAIENIDVGGPAMLRAGAKNHAAVAVLVDSADYARVLADLKANDGSVSAGLRAELAAKAFAHTAAYDGAIANYLTSLDSKHERTGFPGSFTAQFHKLYDLRYGENPHQHAAFYAERSPMPGTLAAARQLQGKELSFNNIADADAALSCVSSFDTPACVIVKHANPCGVALGKTPQLAYERAYSVDKDSAFGGIIAFNRPLDAATAAKILDNQFVEVVVAPEIEPAALKALSAKPNVRALATGSAGAPRPSLDYKRVSGGLLLQDADMESLGELKVVTSIAPTPEQLQDLAFAWRVVKYVKSNAIVYARGGLTLGIGAGQPSRIMSARIAGLKAGEAHFEVKGCVMASDAFLPFRDSVGVAAHTGVSAIIQPGGSMRDKEVIAAAEELKIAMVFTGLRHFRH